MANAKVVVLIFWGIMCLHNYLCLVPCEEGIESIVSMVPFPLAKLLQSLFMDFCIILPQSMYLYLMQC